MANKVEILALDIDSSALLLKMATTRAEIEKLQQAQKSLQQANQTSTVEYQKNAVELARLQSSYNQQKLVVTQLTTASSNFATASNAISQALGNEINTISQARENNKQLLALRNEINLNTASGVEKLNEINAKINENNDFIKANVSAYEQQKIGIGQYKEQIQEAFNNLNIFNGGIGGFIQRSKEAGGAGNLISESFKGVTTGIYGMIKASLAFIATPIGAVITALGLAIGVVVGAFKFMQSAMNSTEAGSNKLAKITGVITGIFNGLFKIIKPLGEYFFNVFVKSLEVAAGGLEKLGKVASSTLKFLGFDKAAASINNLSNSIKKGAAAGEQLAAAEAKLTDAQRKAKLVQLEYQKELEKLRQLRDDETKSLATRTKANADLGIVLKQQLKDELLIAKQALLVLNLRIKSEGKSKENLDAQANALTEIADIQERIVGQESEQLANLNSLRKEAADKAKEQAQKVAQERQATIDKNIQKNKDELDLFIQNQGIKKKSIENEIALEEQILQKKLAILKKEFDAKKITETAYNAAKVAATNETAKKIADITIQQAAKELEKFKETHQQKIDTNKFFTQENLKQKIAENEQIGLKEQEFHVLRLEKGVINQQEFEDAIELVKENTRIKNEEAQKIRDEAQKEKEVIDLENKRIIEDEKFANDFERQLAQEDIRYQQQLKAAEKTGADTTLIEAKHANAKKAINDALENAKMQAAADTFGNISKLLGEATVAGKAAAIAQATINTYQGVTATLSAQSVLPEPFGTAAKIVSAGTILASGLMNVKKIVSTKVPSFDSGGVIPKLSSGIIKNGANLEVPLSNGDDTLAYVGQGEVILNKQQQRAAGGASFFRRIGVPGFAGGGQVAGNTSFSKINGIKIDMNEFVEKITLANQSLPNPIVDVKDIISAGNKVKVIENGANF